VFDSGILVPVCQE